MARELRRLLISPARLAAAATRLGYQPDRCQLSLEPEEIHYVTRVLRCRPGERLALINGEGALWSATLEAPARLRLEQPLEEPLERAKPPSPAITLAMAVPKRDAELVWRMATELGASRLQPLLSSRGVVRGQPPLERWRTIMREATEQCERLWLPTLSEPAQAIDWLQQRPPGTALLATTRQEGLPTMPELLPVPEGLATRPDPGPAELWVAIGPEGGWSPEEEGVALAAGWQAVSLGNAILRTSTAAVSALAWFVLQANRPPAR